MRIVVRRLAVWLIVLGIAAPLSLPAAPGAPAGTPTVSLERVPDGGLQPQVAVGADGTVHLVYFKGEPRHGDLFYCRRGPRESAFGPAFRVNVEPGSAIAIGTIRGAQLAIGRGDRIHVAWNGSEQARPRGPENQTPLLYARMNAAQDGFEPERNLITSAYGLDGGACIAADHRGNVYVAWHAGTGAGEAFRRVWMARSDNDGSSFTEERAIDGSQVGACGCCGMRGSVSSGGEVQFLYRSAQEELHRDMYLLSSADGDEFASRKLDAWEVTACPMSSSDFLNSAASEWAAWETNEQIHTARMRPGFPIEDHGAIEGGIGPQKHPRLATDNRGTVLVVWSEGTGWNRGGAVAWQALDENGQTLPARGRQPGLPVWSFATAFSLPDGRFVVLY